MFRPPMLSQRIQVEKKYITDSQKIIKKLKMQISNLNKWTLEQYCLTCKRMLQELRLMMKMI